MIVYKLKKFVGWASNSNRIEAAITLSVREDLFRSNTFTDRIGITFLNREQFYEFYEKMTELKEYLDQV